MVGRQKGAHSSRGLLALCVAALLLILFVSLLGTRDRGLGCASTASASTETHTAPALESPVAPPVPLESTSAEQAPPAVPGLQVRGQVVDERVGDPVPWIEVEVRDGSQHERVKTDYRGRFETARPFVAGRVEIEVTDLNESFGVTRVDWRGGDDDAAIVIRIDIGPTFLVREIGPRKPDARHEWRLKLVQSALPVWSAGEIDVIDEELRLVDDPDLEWTTRDLRFEGSDVFARWPRVEHEPVVGRTPRMELHSAVLLQRGTALVERTLGVQVLVAGELEDFLVLTGKVITDRQASVPARVLFVPRDVRRGREVAHVPDIREVETQNGSYRVELSAKHSYSLVAWADGFAPKLVDRASVRRGREVVEDVRLEELGEARAGLDAPGRKHDVDLDRLPAVLRARVHETGGFSRAVLFVPEENGRLALGENAPRTEYRIDSVGIDGDSPTRGTSWVQVLPQIPAVEKAPRGELPKLYRFEWLDPLAGTPRFDFAVTAGPEGCILTTKETPPNPTFELEPKANAYFTIWRGGSEPISLQSKDFVDRGGERVALVQPQPGWGVSISFRLGKDPERATLPDGARREGRPLRMSEMLTLPPLQNVAVSSIQGGHGQSDKEGLLLVRSRTWPPRLSVRADGYRLTDLRRVPGPGSRWIAFMEHER